MKKDKTKVNVLIEIVLIFLAFLFFLPILILLINSLKDLNGILNSPLALPYELKFNNYIIVWKDMKYPIKFLNSLFVTIIPLPIIVFFSSMAAYGMERTKTRLSTFIFFIFISSMLIPFQSIMVPIVVMAKKFNIIDLLWGIDIIYVAFGVSFAIFLYHGFMKSVPKELDESAYIEGCGRFYTYLKIVLPLTKSITSVIVILNVLGIWNDLLLPLVILSTPEKFTLPLAIFQFKSMFSMEWQKLLPGVVLTGLPIVVFFLAFQRNIMEGITSGAVKG